MFAELYNFEINEFLKYVDNEIGVFKIASTTKDDSEQSYSFIKVIIPEFNDHHQKDQQILAALGRERKIVFETHNPNCALQSLEHTDYIMLGAKGPANAVYDQMGLTTIDVPKELATPKFSMKFIWHQRQNLPAEQVWFRKLVMSELANSMKT